MITDQFRKKPVVINAFQLPAAGEDVPDAFHEWCERVGFTNFESGRDETLLIRTLEGVMEAAPGDWIIKGVKGEFYPCKPDIFAATYEPAVLALAAGRAKQADVTDDQIIEAYNSCVGNQIKHTRTTILLIGMRMMALAAGQQGALVPDMFWDDNNPRVFPTTSINNIVVEADNNIPLDVGEVLTIQCAKRLPKIKVRITVTPDAEGNGDLGWEVLAAQQGEGGGNG